MIILKERCDCLPSSWRAGLAMPFTAPLWSLLASSLAFKTCWITASTIGITIATVEVLLSHMERKAQPTMNPSINLWNTFHIKQADLIQSIILWLITTHQKYESNKISLTCQDWLQVQSPIWGQFSGEDPISQWMLLNRWHQEATSGSLWNIPMQPKERLSVSSYPEVQKYCSQISIGLFSKSKMTSSGKCTCEDFMIPKRGKSSAGRSAVTDRGMTSVIQYTAISIRIYAHSAS